MQDELARSVTLEQGKTFQDAKGDVFRGLGEAGWCRAAAAAPAAAAGSAAAALGHWVSLVVSGWS